MNWDKLGFTDQTENVVGYRAEEQGRTEGRTVGYRAEEQGGQKEGPVASTER